MKRNKFSLSHYKLASMWQGDLVPIGHYEVLPGDTVQQSTSTLIRVAPLASPVMHPVHARIHHWFVPYRLLWEDWESFITGGPDGMDDSEFPVIQAPDIGLGDLGDYLGIPPHNYTNVHAFSALPFRAYALIFNEWYRDQDLVTPVVMSKASGVDSTTSRQMQRCAWEKDYFTSARPWTQKGPEVTIPIGTTAAVIPTSPGVQPTFNVENVSGTPLMGGNSNQNVVWSNPVVAGGPYPASWDDPGLMADLSTAAAATINDLREAFALQRYEEARARYGSRYSEYLRYLGVRSSDARLQRPEYLGGGKQTVQFSEVLQTAPGTEQQGVGEMRGHGIAAMRSNRFRRFFEEHGIVMTLMSIKPRTMYMQSAHRSWFRRTKEDFWQKELEHIGQQAIENREIYAMSSQPTEVFGYQDRYDEYRRHESSVGGEFRSVLDYWHMARNFNDQPVLNGDFVQSLPTDRVYAAQGNAQIYAMCAHSIQARRMLSKTGTSHIF